MEVYVECVIERKSDRVGIVLRIGAFYAPGSR
jgi:hypothetical protein